MVWFAWNNEVWSFIDKILALCLALQKKKGPPQSQWWRTLISSLHICWFFLFTQCLNFNSKGLNPLCYSEHFLGLKQWSSEFERTGEEQQASIRVWRRGLFTELPSLHLASPLPRLGRQLQFVYLLGLATQILAISCHCLSSHHNEKKKNRQAYTHSETRTSFSLAYSVHYSSSCSLFSKWTPCLSVWVWPLRCSVWKGACYWFSLCSHCARAIQMPVMPARHARCVRTSLQRACVRAVNVSARAHVHVSLTASLLAHGWHHAVILPQFLNEMRCFFSLLLSKNTVRMYL